MDPIAIKVTAASVAMVLAVLQALIMAQLYGKAKIFSLSSEALAIWHRRQGDVILALFHIRGLPVRHQGLHRLG